MNEGNADIHALGSNGPILFWKIQAEENDDAQALLNAGADINVRGFVAQTPAIAAATADDWKSVSYLTDRGLIFHFTVQMASPLLICMRALVFDWTRSSIR